MSSMICSNGWICVDIPERHEFLAKGIRSERDRKYGNTFIQQPTDERWVGDLGEITFNSWLKHENIDDFSWIIEETSGKPDFIVNGIKIDVKTVKRKNHPLNSYMAGITARHATEPVDSFFFMTYQLSERRMWLLGGIKKDYFLQNAQYFGPNEWVHREYQIRPGHEIYNIGVEFLVKPKFWINAINGV